MHNKRIYAILTLISFIFICAAPAFPAESAQQSSVSSAVAEAASALFGGGQTAQNGAIDGVLPADASALTDTGAAEDAQAQPGIDLDPLNTNPDTIVVNELPENEKDKKTPGSRTPDFAGLANAGAINPREIRGSSMYNNIKGRLYRFGDDFFAKVRTNSLAMAPVGPNYVVAPGDQLKINLWGFNEIRANLVVDRDGMVALPQAGVIQAAGISFADLRKNIEAAYKKIFTDFQLEVSMGRLHTINVYVAGNAARPGAYAVSSMATVIDVLSQAGGPSAAGSMRKIQIKRGNKKIADFDVYRLLIHGDRKGDVRLSDGDIIFIPPVGKLVTVAGNVKRPAIYELEDKAAALEDALHLAGGLTSGATKDRIQIVRVEDNTVRTAFEDSLSDTAKKIQLADGDIVKIFAVYGGAITAQVAGAVVQPGVLAIEPGKTTLRDVINRSGGLLYTAAKDAEITRIQVSERGPVTTRTMIDVKNVMEGKTNFVLQRDDYIFVRNVPDWDLYRGVTAGGRVLYPGSYAVKRGERLSSLLERSGGYSDNAFIRGAVFMRASARANQQKAIDDLVVRLERELAAGSNEAISTAAQTKDKDFALAEIEQKNRLLNAIKNTKATGRIIIHLPETLKELKGSAYDLPLEEGDSIYIPERPNTVQVVGAVTAQSTYVFEPGKNVRDYVNQSGGFSAYANAGRSYIIKADGSIVKAFNGTKAAAVEEGDFIVVPEKMIFKQRLRTASDILDILSKTVLSIASVHYIFK